MVIYNSAYNAICSFKGNDSAVNNSKPSNSTDPITTSNEYPQSKELMSSDYSQAVTSNAMSLIAPNGALKYDTTPESYIAALVKAGKIKNKNFTVAKTIDKNGLESGSLYISEFNSAGQKIKNTIFEKNKNTSNYDLAYISFINPNLDKSYKWITYVGEKPGTYSIDKNDVRTGELLSREWYNSNNQLDHKAIIQNGKYSSIEWYNGDKTS